MAERLHDAARLAAVHAIGVLEGTPGTERACRILAHGLGVRWALVSLVDDVHRTLVSALGVDEPRLRRAPLAGAACAEVMRTGAALVVQDTSSDLADSVLGDLGARAFLGIPILVAEGHIVGVLYAAADAPRAWTVADVEFARDVASSLSAELDARLAWRERDVATRARAVTERRYRVVESHLSAVVVEFDRAGRFMHLNVASPPSAPGHNGSPIGRTCQEAGMNWRMAAQWDAAVRQVIDTGTKVAIECSYVEETGPRHYHVEFEPERDGSGDIERVLGICIDVTEARRTELALRQSDLRYRQVFEQSPLPMWVYDEHTYRFLAVNDAAVRQYGWSRDEFLGLSALDVCLPEEIPTFLSRHRDVASAANTTAVVRHRRRDGDVVLVEPAAGRIHFEGRQARIVLLPDVTERVRVEAAIREAEQRFRLLAEHIDSVFFLCTPDRVRVDYVSPAAARLFGASSSEPEAMPWFDGVHPQDRRRVTAALPAMRLGNFEEEYRIVSADGRTRWVRTRAYPVRGPEGDIVLSAGIVEDVTTLKEVEIALTASEAKFRQIVETAIEGIWLLDTSGRTTYANPRTAELLALPADSIVGRAFVDFVDPAGRASAEAMFTRHYTPAASRPELCLRRGDGAQLWTIVATNPVTDDRGEVVGFLAMLTDITEQKKLERQLQHSQKLELIGQLAGGVAHDFNNLLTAIIGNIDLAMTTMKPDDPVSIDLGEARRASERAVELTRQLLAISRRQVLQPRRIVLDVVVNDAKRMLERVLGEEVYLVTTLGSANRVVLADPGQVEQVLVNLVVNARDAMPSGGTLRVDTGTVVLDETTAKLRGREEGLYTTLSVADTGTGMDSETASRIFEPFFTTKGPGEGTGLGLAIVMGIVEQTGGFIHVESVLGQGSCFTVYLPVLAEEADVVADSTVARDIAPSHRGSETIVIVEDERAVRTALRRTLERLGYRVFEAADGAEALELCSSPAIEPLHLVLSDVVLPGMRGPEFVSRLLTRRPGLRVLFMSGYSQEAVAARGRLLPGTAFVEKPFGAQQIARIVRETLDRPAGLARLDT
jgi:two-component system cell cycle sensor histidine kinase/response regulator CckA